MAPASQNRGHSTANNCTPPCVSALPALSPSSTTPQDINASVLQMGCAGWGYFPQWAVLDSPPSLSGPRTHPLSSPGLLSSPSISLCICSLSFASPFSFMAFQIIFFFMLHWLYIIANLKSYKIAWKLHSNELKINAFPLFEKFFPSWPLSEFFYYKLLHFIPTWYLSSFSKSIS